VFVALVERQENVADLFVLEPGPGFEPAMTRRQTPCSWEC
jgi:hypothetical protein